jgi:hypothetical protein
MRRWVPQGFSLHSVGKNEHWIPTFALESDDGVLEAHYSIQPLDELGDAKSRVTLGLLRLRARSAFDRAIRALRFAETVR